MNLIEPRVGALETQMERVATILERVEQGMERRDTALTKRVEELSKPRYSLILTVVGSVLTIAGACFTLLTKENQHSRELLAASEQRSEKRNDQLDIKLQMEQRLLNDTISTRLSTLNEGSRAEHDHMRDEIKHNRDWIESLLKREWPLRAIP